jgi:hypothetical protein
MIMSNEQTGKKRADMVKEVFNLIGGLSGLLSIALLIFKGGVLLQTVDDHDRRIVQMEQGGSSLAREHIKLDDERVQNLKERTARLEAIMASIPNIERDVAVMRVQVENLVKAMDRKPGAMVPWPNPNDRQYIVNTNWARDAGLNAQLGKP